ncbi:MAG TPA: hypothetical protein VE944_01045 [Nostoc sp.]|uniref:hypothetical protein n=1 Tax=Nostoc sp. TaxID=1180 RepID=UPI002D3A0ACB|nr:hypothetical protein [Nostoc sp.]HYX12959.1 hypothetical protein [Nostoc sp.]
MDLAILKKKLSVYRDQGGSIKNVSDELLYELLVSWESWEGTPKDFYSALGSSSRQMAGVIGRAKRYKREGRFGSSEFKEVMVEDQNREPATGGSLAAPASPCNVIELVWPDGRIARFSDLDRFLEFMKRTA